MKYSASVIFFITLVGNGFNVVCAAKDKNAKEKSK
jgi:hypothetical protein